MKLSLKTIVLSLVTAFLLTGCEPSYKENTQTFTQLPDELKDCKFYGVRSNTCSNLNIVRFLNSSVSTTYKVGKTTATTVVIDGKRYVSEE